jgi:hypothetical protein
MLLARWFSLLFATLLLTTAAVAQEAQGLAKELQQSPTVSSLDNVKPTCADADTGFNSALPPVRGFDVFKVERSLGFDDPNWRRVGAAFGKSDNGPEVCSAYCLSRCGECPTCSRGELWDCTSCSCQPI